MRRGGNEGGCPHPVRSGRRGPSVEIVADADPPGAGEVPRGIHGALHVGDVRAEGVGPVLCVSGESDSRCKKGENEDK